ncbi:hypothetical protein [Zhengella mangrovi]|nr:hypothetical protein [Zhengella mangrovi]
MSNFHWDHMRGSSGDSSAPGWGGYLGHEKHRQQQERERLRRSSEAAERLHGSRGGGGGGADLDLLSDFNPLQKFVFFGFLLFVVAPFAYDALTAPGGLSYVSASAKSDLFWGFLTCLGLFALVTPLFWFGVFAVMGLGAAAAMFSTADIREAFYEEFTSSEGLSGLAAAIVVMIIFGIVFVAIIHDLATGIPIGKASFSSDQSGSGWLTIFVFAGFVFGVVSFYLQDCYWRTLSRLEPRQLVTTSPALNAVMRFLYGFFLGVGVLIATTIATVFVIGASGYLSGYLFGFDAKAHLMTNQHLIFWVVAVASVLAAILAARDSMSKMKDDLGRRILQGERELRKQPLLAADDIGSHEKG